MCWRSWREDQKTEARGLRPHTRGLAVVREEDQEKPNGLGIEEYSRDTTATAGRKELRREELLFRNTAVDYELDQI